MKKYIKLLVIVVIVILAATCETYDFDKEHYKNEVSLLSNSELIYDRQVANLESGGDTIYVVAHLSGSVPSTEVFNVALTESDSLFHAYNKSNFDIDSDRFAKLLPRECYSIPKLEMQIPAGETRAKFPIYLNNLDKLSPDTLYFLNYKIDPVKTDYYNPSKNEVLIRIYMENEFATTVRNTNYNYTSSIIETLATGAPAVKRPTSTNQVFPLGANSVRMMAGDETFGDYKSALNSINSNSIKVTVGEQTPENVLARLVTIEPYKTLDVVQLPPSGIYNNTYLINIISTPDGRSSYYKEFRLHYKYRLNSTAPYLDVKAILRMEYNPRAEQL